MYSQNDEEKVILEYFGESMGRLYDIGAWCGSRFSNSWALLEKGWRGVLVEPAPQAFTSLLEATIPFGERVTLINAAITPKNCLMDFYDAGGDAVGSMDPGQVKKWNLTGRKFLVHPIPASILFKSFGHAEFISLDVEGMNAILFQHLPWQWPTLKMVCVEHDGHEEEMQAAVEPFGFHRIHRTGENLILAK